MSNNLETKGFTLAEVLITLGIIGIIAAMTIPALINKYTEIVTVNKVKQTYAILSQAYLKAQDGNGSLELWDITPGEQPQGAQKLYDYFKPYLVGIKDCSTNKKGCFAKHYRAMFYSDYGAQPEILNSWYAKGVLANGTSFVFDSAGKCLKNILCGYIYVDINGLKGPNVAGIDYFAFDITPSAIVPSYYKHPNSIWSAREYCLYNYKSYLNGARCTGWVIKKGNLDYLYRDVSNEMDYIGPENY